MIFVGDYPIPSPSTMASLATVRFRRLALTTSVALAAPPLAAAHQRVQVPGSVASSNR
jgi:hypothetical protein